MESKLARHLMAIQRVIESGLPSHNLPSTPSGNQFQLVPFRSHAHTPVAFLVSFTEENLNLIFPLKNGVNRIGRDVMWGDHQRCTERTMEGRQFLLVCKAGHAYVADDHSTNQSLVIAKSSTLPLEIDPRIPGVKLDFSKLSEVKEEGVVHLDWDGNVFQEISSGDVLVTAYSAFAFSWLTTNGGTA